MKPGNGEVKRLIAAGEARHAGRSQRDAVYENSRDRILVLPDLPRNFSTLRMIFSAVSLASDPELEKTVC